MKRAVLITVVLNAAFVGLAALATAQSSFDSARIHNHVVSTTFEGVWHKRMEPIKDQYPLGSRLAVKGTTEMWFWYGFDPLKDGPMIAMAESTPSGMKVKVTYDPVCFYITKLELLGPVLPVIPRPTPEPLATPTPVPSPAREALDIAWPPSEAARSALWKDKITPEGWANVVIYNNRLRAWRARP